MMKRLIVIMFTFAAFGLPLCAMADDSQDPPSGHVPTKTANFVYYTIEVPLDWNQVGTGKMQPGDRTLLVTALNLSGIEGQPTPDRTPRP